MSPRVAPPLISLLLSAGLAVGCAESVTDSDPSHTATLDMSGADAIVEVHDNRFMPDATEIDVGATVAWDFSSADRQHNVVFDAGPESETLDDGVWTTTFEEAGTYPYQCTLHADMTGRITVTGS